MRGIAIDKSPCYFWPDNSDTAINSWRKEIPSIKHDEMVCIFKNLEGNIIHITIVHIMIIENEMMMIECHAERAHL